MIDIQDYFEQVTAEKIQKAAELDKITQDEWLHFILLKFVLDNGIENSVADIIFQGEADPMRSASTNLDYDITIL